MSKKVVLVSHCGPDSSFLRLAVSKAIPGAKVLMVDDQPELERLITDGVDLLLVNRELEPGFDDTLGVNLIARLRTRHPGVRAMLISNYADAQAAALANGALPGFGKREIGSSRVTELLRSGAGVTESARA